MINLGRDVSSVNGSTNFVDGKYYHFYDRMLINEKDAPWFYQQLLASAKQSIVIWDPYYYLDCEDIFCQIEQDNLYVEILTICDYQDNKNNMNDFADRVLKAIDKGKAPNCTVRVYAFIPRYSHDSPWSKWHDRFLIIDNADVYLIGSSMDSQILIDGCENKSRSFGIMKITESEDLDLIKRTYENYRNLLKEGPRGNGYKCLVQRP